MNEYLYRTGLVERAFGVTHYRLENVISGFALEK